MNPRADQPTTTLDNGITLAHESFGNPDDPVVLLIAGLGAQLLSWDARLCQRLAAGGRRVIRFDNRDCGHSTHFDDHPVDLGQLTGAASTGDQATVARLAPYTLRDLAADAVGLLDALDIARAHVVGASMGGMVAQWAAIDRPDRVTSLTSMSSSTGEPDVGQSSPEAMAALMQPPAPDREARIAAAVAAAEVWGSRRHFNHGAAAALATAADDRARSPAGTTRQLAAMLASGTTADALPTVAAPTLVIHGLDDTLIDPSGGQRTAELIPGAELRLIPDMGHDRPEPLWPTLVEAILGHTDRS